MVAGFFNHRLEREEPDYCYNLAKRYLCENYYIDENAKKIDIHHLHSQGDINQLFKKSWDNNNIYAMFRDSFANTYPIEHNAHLSKKKIVINPLGLNESAFPEWSFFEFNQLIRYFAKNIDYLITLNYGFEFVENKFITTKKTINGAILRETLAQACLDALDYLPEWVKE